MNLIEKHFGEDYREREEEEKQEELKEEQKIREEEAKEAAEMETCSSWSSCFLPSGVRQTCFVLLSCS